MTSMFLTAQVPAQSVGWLSSNLLGVTLPGVEWALWVLVILSAISIAVMMERTLYFVRYWLKDSEELGLRLARGGFEAILPGHDT